MQSFAILSKINKWDEVLRLEPEFASRVYEVHPEVTFAAMNGEVGLAASKKSREGREARIRLVTSAFGYHEVASLLARVPRNLAKPDDVLDALAAAWSAQRIRAGQSRTLPKEAPVDAYGLRMATTY